MPSRGDGGLCPRPPIWPRGSRRQRGSAPPRPFSAADRSRPKIGAGAAEVALELAQVVNADADVDTAAGCSAADAAAGLRAQMRGLEAVRRCGLCVSRAPWPNADAGLEPT